MATTAARHALALACATLVLLQMGAPRLGALEEGIAAIFGPDANWLSPAELTPEPVPAPAARRISRLFIADDHNWLEADLPADFAGDGHVLPLDVCASTDLCVTDELRRRYARPSPSQSRGPLIPLYVSFATLQALDVHSTLLALDRGAVEKNPLAAGLVHRPGAFIAIKAGAAAGAIVLAEQIRPHSRVGAIVLMGALNSLYATVVAHNYQVAAAAR